MSKGLEALKEIAIQSVEVFIKREPIRTNKINEMLETKQFKTIEKELKAKDLVFNKLSINIRKVKCPSGNIVYHLVYGWLYSIEISQEQYELLKEVFYET